MISVRFLCDFCAIPLRLISVPMLPYLAAAARLDYYSANQTQMPGNRTWLNLARMPEDQMQCMRKTATDDMIMYDDDNDDDDDDDGGNGNSPGLVLKAC